MATAVSLQRTIIRRHRRRPTGWQDLPSNAASHILSGTADAHPLDTDTEFSALGPPPGQVTGHTVRTAWTSTRFLLRQGDLLFSDAAQFGSVLQYQLIGAAGGTVVLSDPAHVKAVMTADPDLVPSASASSPLRPIVGPQSVLMTVGAEHHRQRRLLMPRFHGSAIADLRADIVLAIDRQISRWSVGEPIRLAGLAQQVTLDVIMAAVFGIDDPASASAAEAELHRSMVTVLRRSAQPLGTAAEFMNAGRQEPRWTTTLVLRPIDRAIYRVIEERRADRATARRTDILSMLMGASTDDGNPLSDSEIRDQVLTIVLAGHETTANTVAWTFERLTRHPKAYHDARDAAAVGDEHYLEALINESMRSRPVVPLVGRDLLQPWQFGAHTTPAGTTALISVLLLHHHDDLYPRPFDFDPGRFLGRPPSPTTLVPFGGGNRRCLGAALAMTELKIVIPEILRRVSLKLTDRPPERPQHRNVTMIPADGGVVMAGRVQR